MLNQQQVHYRDTKALLTEIRDLLQVHSVVQPRMAEEPNVERSGNTARSADRLAQDLHYIVRMMENQMRAHHKWIEQLQAAIARLEQNNSASRVETRDNVG